MSGRGEPSESCELVAVRTLGAPVKEAGADLFWRCPRHLDKNPFLIINLTRNEWRCEPCHAGGAAWQLAAFLAGARTADRGAGINFLRKLRLLPDVGKPQAAPVVSQVGTPADSPTAQPSEIDAKGEGIPTMSSTEDIARAALGEPVKHSGAELLWRCPNHEDEHPSLSVNPKKNVWMCGPCGASGNAWQLAAFLAKLSADDKPAVRKWLADHGLLSKRSSGKGKRPGAGLTLAHYAEAKRLPTGFLESVGVKEIVYEQAPALEIPYYGTDGEVVARRFRVALTGEKRFLWETGAKLLPYGLWRLNQGDADYIVLVEGESDCHTLWRHGLLALGVPGVEAWRHEWASPLARFQRVYAVIEPDQGGRTFRSKLLKSPLRDRLAFIALDGYKDPSALHCANPESFPDRWSEALSRAVRPSECTNIGEVLDRIVEHNRRYVVMTESQALVVALWIAHTHVFDAADATPYLAVNSAEKQSGKTRLLEVCELLVANPWLTGRTTAAVLPRKIDADHPALLLDEGDAAFSGPKEYAEALRSVLNTGQRRGGCASCCVGKGAEISFRDFSTFCPKAIAGIGKLPDTVADRSIPIRLKRATPGERIQRFRRREVEPEAAMLRGRLEAWGAMEVEKQREARPALPGELTDRQQDGAEPLLAIADAAGGEWPKRARGALIELCGEAQAADDSIGVQLLRDIKAIFSLRGADRLPSAELAAALAEVEGSPWGEWTHGKPLTASRLARLLKRYEIAPGTIRVSEATHKGYLLSQFEDAFKRYSLYPPFQKVTPSQPNIDAGASDFSKGNTKDDVTFQKPDKSNEKNDVTDVTFSNPRTGTQEGSLFPSEGENVVTLQPVGAAKPTTPKLEEVEWEA